MAEEIKDLIEKINQEGIIAAQQKAAAIEAAAVKRAEEILIQAQKQAEEMVTAATDKISRENEIQKALMAQAGRDFLLSLKNEIQAMLGRIVLSKVQQALTPETLSVLITEMIRNYEFQREESGILILLDAKDWEILKNHFLSELSREVTKPIQIRSAEEISGGFTISYDSGRSYHDFSDKALADHISRFLKPKLNLVLEESVKTEF